MKKNNQVLSVIVPIYNTENYLHQCLNSIVNQSYEQLDIILVNDGSTDNSGKIAEEYKGDSRVRVIHTPNGGSNKARLIGIEHAIGEYATFVDSDDWIDQDMYENMMHQITKYDADMIMCGMSRFFANAQGYQCIPSLEEGLYVENHLKENVWLQMLWNDKLGTNSVNASLCSKIIRKDMLYKNLKKAAQLGVYYGDDAAVLFPTMLDIHSIYVTHKAFYHHRQREKEEAAPYIKDDNCVEKLLVLYQFLKQQFIERGYANLCEKQLDLFYMKLLELRKNYLEFVENVNRYVFPFDYVQANDKVIIYGAGKVGQTYVTQNEKYHFCNIILWVDKNHKKLDMKWNIAAPEKIKETEYDYIIIAVQTSGLAREIKDELMILGVPKNKIVWENDKIQRLIC